MEKAQTKKASKTQESKSNGSINEVQWFFFSTCYSWYYSITLKITSNCSVLFVKCPELFQSADHLWYSTVYLHCDFL